MFSPYHKHTRSLLISTRKQHGLLLVILIFLSVSHSILAKEEKRPILGIQRWDMYSGKGATHKQELGYIPGKQGILKTAEWHLRAPFFCRLTKDVDFVKHPPNAGPLWFNHPCDKKILQNAMDQEIRFAHQAGIDFFVYHGPARNLVADGWGLKNNLDAQMKSKLPEAKKMKFIWALYGHKSMNYSRIKVSLMMDEAIEYIKLPNWQTVMNGRPLLVIMWPDNFKAQLESKAGNEHMTGSDFLKYVRKRVIDTGLKNPYIVGMAVPARSHLRAEDWKTEGYDTFSDYAGDYGGMTAQRNQAPTYAQATEKLKKHGNSNSLGKHFHPSHHVRACSTRGLEPLITKLINPQPSGITTSGLKKEI